MLNNPPIFSNLCLQMRLFSIGSLYIGRDRESFFDVSIHLGNFRLEWDDNKRRKNESFEETID